MISRVFVANRGEIAVRIVRACRALGIECVVGFSAADRTTLAVSLADRAVCIGPAAARDSYLDVPVIVAAAMGTGCDALHPGYGFLAERPELAEACREHGIAFVGPSPEAMRAAGDKVSARRIAEKVGVPLAPGSEEIETPEEAAETAEKIGYPVLLKASAGGGGRGMRVVRSAKEVRPSFEQASAEAREAFGDGRLFLERYFESARHVEVQVVGDASGEVIHLGDRDCSLQRRHQKIVEEAPAPELPEAIRRGMHDAAVSFAKAIDYVSAGTIEFLFDPESERFAFLEMNTRIQVEHPVTEIVTGVDLVAEQIRIASGERLSIAQKDVAISGHAVECRVNVEDPDRDFFPSPGRITSWREPEGEGIRVDTHGYEGYVVPPFYDSLLAKVIGDGADRAHAIERTLDAVSRFEIGGVATNLPFHRFVLAHDDFRAARVSTRWLETTGVPQYREKRRRLAS